MKFSKNDIPSRSIQTNCNEDEERDCDVDSYILRALIAHDAHIWAGIEEGGHSGKHPRERPTIPEARNVISDPSMRIPTSHLRIIQQEIERRDYDARTVLLACQGLVRGSQDFDLKYFQARLSAYLALKRRGGIPTRVLSHDENSHQSRNSQASWLAIRYPSDLMRQLWIWLSVLIGLESWNSWQLANYLDTYLLGGRLFLAFAVFFVFFIINSILWFRCRGGSVTKFYLPGTILMMACLAMGCTLHICAA